MGLFGSRELDLLTVLALGISSSAGVIIAIARLILCDTVLSCSRGVGVPREGDKASIVLIQTWLRE